MKTYLFLISLCITLSAAAQDGPKLLHYNGDWKPAKPKKAAFLVEQIQQNDTCYEWNYYVAGGPRFLSAGFKDPGGKVLHGDYTTYTDNGYMDTTGQYANGKKHGEWIVHASNHRTLYELVYRDDVLISTKDSMQLNKERTLRIDSIKAGRTIVEIESEFRGGARSWQQYLMKNLNYPQQAIDNNVSGEVIVQFIVNKDGNVEDVDLYKSAEYYIDKEAMRLIKDSPTWTPAMQDGKKVKSYKRQPIRFGLRR
jgi:TonB family protein